MKDVLDACLCSECCTKSIVSKRLSLPISAVRKFQLHNYVKQSNYLIKLSILSFIFKFTRKQMIVMPKFCALWYTAYIWRIVDL